MFPGLREAEDALLARRQTSHDLDVLSDRFRALAENRLWRQTGELPTYTVMGSSQAWMEARSRQVARKRRESPMAPSRAADGSLLAGTRAEDVPDDSCDSVELLERPPEAGAGRRDRTGEEGQVGSGGMTAKQAGAFPAEGPGGRCLGCLRPGLNP